MKLLVVTSREDRSRKRIIEEARKKGLEGSLLFYEDLKLHGLMPEGFRGFDFCILRDPYNTGQDFSELLRTILSFMKSNRVLDYSVYQKYPRYEDKLFQHSLFKDIMAMPRFWHHSTAEGVDVKSFPIIVKKRIGSRGRGIFVINTKKEMNKFFEENDITDYFLEEYIKIKKDIRVLLMGNEVVGAVERRFRIKDNKGYSGVGVKVIRRFEIPEDIRKKMVEVSRAVESDFCGIDYVIDERGHTHLLECNVSPQFVSFERVSGINVAEKLIAFIIDSCKT